MSNLLRLSCLSLALATGQNAVAVDPNRLWLPKKLKHVQPKLLAAARQAEQTERCTKVISGEMIPGRSTSSEYFFVITCRDENRKSYNISYQYPVDGGEINLIQEQRVKTKEVLAQEEAQKGLNAQQRAQMLCEEEIQVEALLLGRVTLLDEQAEVVNSSESGNIHLNIPVDITNPFGNIIAFTAQCSVDDQDNIEVVMAINPRSVIDLCISDLKRKTRKMRSFNILHDQLPELKGNSDEGYLAIIPFDAKNPAGRQLFYQGECRVKDDGRSETVINPRA